MLLRDVVWLGIASKLSLLLPYTTLLRDVVWFGIASKLSLLSPYTTLRPSSSRFGYPLPPPWEQSYLVVKSEGTTKARRRQSVSTFDIMIPKNPKIRVPLLRKKVAPDDNYNNNKCEPLFTPHFSSCKANTMTVSYILFCMKYIRTIVVKILHFTFYMQCVLAFESLK